MSSTYPDSFSDPMTAPTAASAADVDFVPAYARKPTRQKKVKSWMILAPIGAVVLIGGAVAMMMNSGGEPTPLVEPAPTPVIQAPITPTVDAVSTTAMVPAPAASVEANPVIVPAPAARRVESVRAGAPSAARRATPAPASRVIQVQAEPTGPRAYMSEPTASAPVEAPAPAIRAPAITPQPLT